MSKDEIINIAVLFIVSFIFVISIFQDDKRRMCALVFSFFTSIHTLAWGLLPSNGNLYFFTAALNDLIIIYVITHLKDSTKLTERISIICLLFMIANLAGLIRWNYWPSIYLDSYASMLLYLSAIVALLTWDGEEDGNYRFDILAWYSRHNNKRVFACQKLPEEAKH